MGKKEQEIPDNQTVEWTTIHESEDQDVEEQETYQIVETVDNHDSLKEETYLTEVMVTSPTSVQVDEVVNREIASRVHKPKIKRISHQMRQPTEFHDVSSTDKDELDNLLSIFLIGCNLTFDIVDTEYFRNFVQKLSPSYKIPSSKQLTKNLLQKLSNKPSTSNGFTGHGQKRSMSDDDSDDDDNGEKRQKF